jgi:hypothetical protein
MQQPGILQPAEADSPSIGRRRFTELAGALCTRMAIEKKEKNNAGCWLALLAGALLLLAGALLAGRAGAARCCWPP